MTGVLGKNMLLFFAYADFEETRVKYEKVHSIYQRILDIEDIDPTLVRNETKSNLLFNFSQIITISSIIIIILISNYYWNWTIFLMHSKTNNVISHKNLPFLYTLTYCFKCV